MKCVQYYNYDYGTVPVCFDNAGLRPSLKNSFLRRFALPSQKADPSTGNCWLRSFRAHGRGVKFTWPTFWEGRLSENQIPGLEN